MAAIRLIIPETVKTASRKGTESCLVLAKQQHLGFTGYMRSGTFHWEIDHALSQR
ncbi:hypothetical protein [Pseudomonas aeruginosa]|uniref:hypothetical protein n=1 Tax=Pseudomonas aeruginosa TaxID=287 RepID=UPI0021B4BBB3|nr:hypothetical protein [Pseudomonas aeruginosa]MCT7418581.1 hypothetical protein [Pseudomonas aeruginosa]